MEEGVGKMVLTATETPPNIYTGSVKGGIYKYVIDKLLKILV